MSFVAAGKGFSSITSVEDLEICQTLKWNENFILRLVRTRSQRPRYYALKAMRKEDLLQTGGYKYVLREKCLLSSLRHPFITKLLRTFNDPICVYLLLEYLPGSDLSSFIRLHSVLPNDVALFYAAEIVLALSHLHEQHIAFRDLCPESIFLSKKGHAKLCNFYCARSFSGPGERSRSACGFQHYISPEAIKGIPHGLEVDLWALGVLLYEMVMGVLPFIDDNPQQLYVKMLTSRVVMGRGVSEDLGELIAGLLVVRPEKRLKIAEVMDHPWFDGVDFEMVLRKEIDPPWHPKLSSSGDASWYSCKDSAEWEDPDSVAAPSELDSF